MGAPLISIVTVVRNDRLGFEATDQSIARQQFRDFEWVVVDGASTDGLPDDLKWNQHISRWVSEPDRGIYDAMNKGVTLSRGEYVVFLNAGDTLPDASTLMDVASAIRSGAGIDVVFGAAILRVSATRVVLRSPRQFETYICHGLPTSHQATYIRTQLLRQYPYSGLFRICGDYELMARLWVHGIHSVYVASPLVEFDMNGTSRRSKRRLISEPYQIQRRILRLSRSLCLKSMLKRTVATAAVACLQASASGGVGDLVCAISTFREKRAERVVSSHLG